MLRAFCQLSIGVMIAALVVRTWLVLGLVVPVTVSGSSMAPTLQGPHRTYRCSLCEMEFNLGLEEALAGKMAVCPHCRKWSAVASSADLEGDHLLIDRAAFAFRKPRRWEVVVFRSPLGASQLCVKRIVGLPGETIALADGKVLINGSPIAHPHGTKFEFRYGDKLNPSKGYELGSNEYFVLGDNAAISVDSRNWPHGPGLDEKRLVGKALGAQ